MVTDPAVAERLGVAVKPDGGDAAAVPGNGPVGADIGVAEKARSNEVSATGAARGVQLEEASPLKSRECLAFGLPLVVAYADTDLDGVPCDFLLKIPNKEDNIQTHGQLIRDFAYRMRGKRVERRHILQIDQGIKEAERLDFFQEIIRSPHGDLKNAA